MITFAPFPETETLSGERLQLGWLPLLLLSIAAVVFDAFIAVVWRFHK
jgi:hypothetical protein